jgi:hypothetical protein
MSLGAASGKAMGQSWQLVAARLTGEICQAH